MEIFAQTIDLFLHLDQYLLVFLQEYGLWVYALLFAIIFAETGFVITPFLPGDSLLFVAGTLAAGSGLDVTILVPLLIAASFGGDNTNYWIGHHLGPRVFNRPNSLLLNRAYLDKTRHFYDQHGRKTVFLARFLPIVRTFAPFVAGVGRMPYGRFMAMSFSGSIAWVGLFVLAGYYFGHLEVVRKNLTLVMLAIIVLSILPGAIAWIRHRREKLP